MHSGAETPTRTVLAEPEWRRRLAEEIDRATTYRRSLAAVTVAGVRAEEKAAARAALADGLPRLDVLGEGADGHLLVLRPEVGRDAHGCGARVLELLAAVAPNARAGLAVCPSDAVDVDSLLYAARAAARDAAAGKSSRRPRPCASTSAGAASSSPIR